jgi:hypothetical protein
MEVIEPVLEPRMIDQLLLVHRVRGTQCAVAFGDRPTDS